MHCWEGKRIDFGGFGDFGDYGDFVGFENFAHSVDFEHFASFDGSSTDPAGHFAGFGQNYQVSCCVDTVGSHSLLFVGVIRVFELRVLDSFVVAFVNLFEHEWVFVYAATV